MNQGSAAASNIGLTVVATDQFKVASARGPSAAKQDGNRVTFTPLAALAPGAEAAFVVNCQAVQAGEARIRVELSADQLTPGTSLKQEESTTIVGEPPRGAKP